MATVLAIAIAAARAFSIVVTQLVVDEKKYLCFHVVLIVSWSHGRRTRNATQREDLALKRQADISLCSPIRKR
jgi:hypothetical protein